MKKIIITIAASLGLPLVASADAFSSTIPLPPSFVDNMLGRFASAFADLSPITYTIMGILLALVITETIILMIRK
jgi:hypothetical protein